MRIDDDFELLEPEDSTEFNILLDPAIPVQNESKELVVNEVPNLANAAGDQSSTRDDLDEDYVYVRKNLKELIANGNDALENILNLAKATDHPRAYEVVGQILKHISDVNNQLLNLHTETAKLKAPAEGPRNVTHNNALFIGSTHELQKLLKGMSPGKTTEIVKGDSDDTG